MVLLPVLGIIPFTVWSNCLQRLYLLSVFICNIFVACYLVCIAWSCAAIISLSFSPFRSPLDSHRNLSSSLISSLSILLILLLYEHDTTHFPAHPKRPKLYVMTCYYYYYYYCCCAYYVLLWKLHMYFTVFIPSTNSFRCSLGKGLKMINKWPKLVALTWYCRDRVSSSNIYAVQQDTQSDFNE